jgi:hypothetical protein
MTKGINNRRISRSKEQEVTRQQSARIKMCFVLWYGQGHPHPVLQRNVASSAALKERGFVPNTPGV